jgi:hypothetical protein
MPVGHAKVWFSFLHTSTQWLADENETQLACAAAPDGASEQSALLVQRLAQAQPAATFGVWLPTPKHGTLARLQSFESPWHSSV